jgi:integrase
MNRTLIENQRVSIFESLYGVTTQTEILKKFKEELLEFKTIRNDDDYKNLEASRIFSKYVLAITFLYSLASIKNNLKAYKKVITELRIGEVLQKKFYFEGLYTTVSKTTKAKIEVKKDTDKKMPMNVIEEITRVKSVLEKNSFKVSKNQSKEQVRSYYLAYVLGLATGRRFTEIFKTIKIHSKNNDFVFIGLLKKKDSLKNQELKAHFLGLTALEARKYLSELRTYLNDKLQKEKDTTLKELTENQINTIFSKVYNNAVARISNKKAPNFHELRHFYTITYQDIYLAQNPHLEDNSEQELSVILQDVRYTILGHEIKEDTTSTYVTFK